MKYKVEYRQKEILSRNVVRYIPAFVAEYDSLDDASAYEKSVFEIMEMFDEASYTTGSATFTCITEEEELSD